MRLAVAVLIVFVTAATAQKPKEPTPAERVLKEGGIRTGEFVLGVRVSEGPFATPPELTITYTITHEDGTRRLAFRNWSRVGTAKITDEFGNTYRRLVPVSGERSPETVTVYSDGLHIGSVAFERPVPKAESLTLELSGENVGSKEPIQLTFRRDAKVRTRWNLEKGKPKP